MSVTVMAFIFFGITLGLVAIPFIPCLREWVKRTDAEPLKVIRRAEVDIRHFERGFRTYIEANLKDDIEKCRTTGQAVEGELADKTAYLVVPDENWLLSAGKKNNAKSDDRMILSCGDLQLPPETVYPVELYSSGLFRGGDKNIFRAVLAESRIRLGRESISLRWMHAGEVVNAKPECILYGRVSAGNAILLSDGCRFERLHAPLIEFGKGPDPPNTVERPIPDYSGNEVVEARNIPHLVEDAAGRWLIDNKLELSSEETAEANLVVTGWAKLGDRCRIAGSVKTRQNIYLGKEVVVEGSVVSEKNIYIGEGCRIKGPVLSEGDVFIERRTVIGSTDIPTTISAEGIHIASGARSYGTVWAHDIGQVHPWEKMSKVMKESQQV